MMEEAEVGSMYRMANHMVVTVQGQRQEKVENGRMVDVLFGTPPGRTEETIWYKSGEVFDGDERDTLVEKMTPEAAAAAPTPIAEEYELKVYSGDVIRKQGGTTVAEANAILQMEQDGLLIIKVQRVKNGVVMHFGDEMFVARNEEEAAIIFGEQLDLIEDKE